MHLHRRPRLPRHPVPSPSRRSYRRKRGPHRRQPVPSRPPVQFHPVQPPRQVRRPWQVARLRQLLPLASEACGEVNTHVHTQHLQQQQQQEATNTKVNLSDGTKDFGQEKKREREQAAITVLFLCSVVYLIHFFRKTDR